MPRISDPPTQPRDIWEYAVRSLTDKDGFGLKSQAFPFTNPATPVDLSNVQTAISPTGTGREARLDNLTLDVSLLRDASLLFDSSYLFHSNDPEKTVTQTTYTLQKEVDLNDLSGNLRITHQAADLNVAGGVYTRIYRNGVGVGPEHLTGTSTFQTYTDDISGWSADDLLQLYAYIGTGADGRVRNLRIYTVTPGLTNIRVKPSNTVT